MTYVIQIGSYVRASRFGVEDAEPIERRSLGAGADGEPAMVNQCASAHDLRRSFGFRWSCRVMPTVLGKLMRHESIETTMR